MEDQLSTLGLRLAPATLEPDDGALRESEEKFSKAFYHVPALLALIRLTDGVCIDVNKRFETVSGYRREEVIGRTSVEGGWATPEERARVFEAIARDGRATALQVSLRRKDGSRVECLCHGEPIAIGGQRHVLLMAEDRSGHVTVAVASSPRGSETVLVVEDDDAVRRVAVATLKNYGYKVLEAAGGSEALAVADHHPSEIQLVLAGVVMSRMTGRDLAFRLRQTRPRVGVLYMSGYAVNDLVERGMIDPGEACVSKPFTPEGLATAVRKALGNGGGPPRIPIVDDGAGIRACSSALWKRVAI